MTQRPDPLDRDSTAADLLRAPTAHNARSGSDRGPGPTIVLIRSLADALEDRDYDRARRIMKELRPLGVSLVFLGDLAALPRNQRGPLT